MPSRMSRYYGSRTPNSRSERNAELYKSLYQTATDYSNVSMVATLEHPNEIEIDKIKQLIKDRETYQKQKEVSSLYKKQELKEKTVPVEWITPDGHDVTEDFIRYARPLIQGNISVPLGEDGLPEFVYRK